MSSTAQKILDILVKSDRIPVNYTGEVDVKLIINQGGVRCSEIKKVEKLT